MKSIKRQYSTPAETFTLYHDSIEKAFIVEFNNSKGKLVEKLKFQLEDSAVHQFNAMIVESL